MIGRAWIKTTGVTRRAFVLGSAATLAGCAAPASEPYHSDVEISAEDVAWFRSCRSVWIDCESGAPAIIPGGMTIEAYGNTFDTDGSPIAARMQRVLCAFFLHATFGPGHYAFRAPVDGHSTCDVTRDDIRLLQTTSWRTSAIDCKRPYGDFSHYEIDMARALGLAITRNARGEDEVAPEVEARMDALHRGMQFVLQAYVEHATLAPGAWFVPYDGWANPVLPRCVPVSAWAIWRYKLAMAEIALRSHVQAPVDLVIPQLDANAALFAVD